MAGAGMAAGVLLLAPQVQAVVGSGESGHDRGIEQLSELAQRSVVYARDGSVLAVLHAEENRSPVPLDDVPKHVVDAILAVEDERYWDHGGVDLRATARAFMTNLSSGEVRQGGSTITQQLVKNSLLTPEQTVGRKFKEAMLAVRLENKLSKDEILERYLNTVYFGNGAYGVQAAAEVYFGKDAVDLTLEQAVFLAGIIRNPIGYDPIKFPDAAAARRDVAVDRLLIEGGISSEQARELKRYELPKAVAKPVAPPQDHFVEAVKQVLLDDERLGETATERYNAVFKGGLRIHTTLDPRMQKAAQDALATILPDGITRGRFTGALVSVEPLTGAVRALAGGQSFEQSKYNLVTQGRRQTGSAFKPIVLAAALEDGYSPNDTINGTSPCHIKWTPPYEPQNFEGEGGGVMSLTDATVHSVNCAYVKLAMVVGLDKVADMANNLGLTGEFKQLPSMSLGAQEVSPLEMASAYGTFAADGTHHAPHLVERVLDRKGKRVFAADDEGDRRLPAQVARVETQVLRQVVERGTGTRARLSGRQVAGKTGTSQNHENAWFVGYTPQLSTAVWMGAPEGNVSMTNVGGIRVTGGSYPARIWNSFMSEALEGEPGLTFSAPNPRQIAAGKYIRDDAISTDKAPSSTVPGKQSPTTVGEASETTQAGPARTRPTFLRPTTRPSPRPGRPGRPTTTRRNVDEDCFPFCDEERSR